MAIKNFTTTKNLSANEQGYVLFEEDILPAGYEIIAAYGRSAHAATVCGGPMIDSGTNRSSIPYIASSTQTPETFYLTVITAKNNIS